jgi:hypothetical protein
MIVLSVRQSKQSSGRAHHKVEGGIVAAAKVILRTRWSKMGEDEQIALIRPCLSSETGRLRKHDHYGTGQHELVIGPCVLLHRRPKDLVSNPIRASPA